MTENRTKLFDGVYFTHIPTDKYETSRLTVNFICPLDESTVTEYTLLMSVLRQSSAVFPSFSELNRALSDLYGAVLYSDSTKVGDAQILSVGTEFLREDTNGNSLSRKAVELLCGMLFSPKVSDGGFFEDDVKTEKDNLRDEILSEINDKKRYAVKRAIKTVFGECPFSLSVNGNEEHLGTANGKILYECYNKMLGNAVIEIIYDGSDEKDVIKVLSDNIGNIKGRNPVYVENSELSIPQSVKTASEKMKISQSKQVLLFHSEETDPEVMKVLNGIFGGTAFSKLFLTVREKMSLCYYCDSAFVKSKNLIIVQSGIDNGNAEKSEKAILSEFQKIQSGEISEEELEDTKKYIVGLLRSVSDSPSSYFDRLISRFVLGGISSEDEIKRIEQVTKEEIVSAARKTKLCGSFLLEGDCK